MKRQFPQLGGLQSTLLCQNKGFSSAIKSHGALQDSCDFLGHCTLKLSCLVVQILFVAERDHWVATSYHQDEIRLYDSKCYMAVYKNRLLLSTKKLQMVTL